ncbi:hypothetical protein ACFLZX_04425 [Nanoarchaeota archaeon]
MNQLLAINWEKFVGRRQPPLRGCYALLGVIKWLKDHNFDGDYSKLFIYFSKLKDNDAISDHYVNIELKRKIIDQLKSQIKNDLSKIKQYLEEFRQVTNSLLEYSKNIEIKKEFTIEDFKEFSKHWEDFGPNLYIFLLLNDAAEEVILDDYNNDPKIKTKLMNVVSSNVKSEFFSTNSEEVVENDFPDKYNEYISLLIELMEYLYRFYLHQNISLQLQPKYLDQYMNLLYLVHHFLWMLLWLMEVY